MSGIEIVGLVLGVIPLVISAMEHYHDGLDPIKAFLDWKGRLSTALRELWYQHTLYQMSVHLLLKDLTSQTEFKEMMVNPRSGLWKDENIGRNIWGRLGLAYLAYLETVVEIGSIVKALSTSLGIEKGGRMVTHDELEAIVIANPPVPSLTAEKPQFEFRKRLDFTMRRREVARLSAKLKECNGRLHEYLERAEKLNESPAPKPKWQSTFVAPLPQIQAFANSLHRVLGHSWGCLAHTCHCASLLLEHRIEKGPQDIDSQSEATRLTVSFSHPSVASTWQDAEFNFLGDATLSDAKAAKVKFTVSSPPSQSAESLAERLRRLNEITELCSILQDYSNATGRLGFCLDQQGRLRGIHPIERLPCISDGIISLQQLLTAPPLQRGRPYKLSTGDCYLLAVVPASSLLQLYETPWIGAGWTRNDIFFPKREGPCGIAVDVQRPFVTHTYQSAINLPPEHTHKSNDTTSADDASRLLKLGIMLLEIFSGQTIESRKQEEDLEMSVKPGDVADLCVLRRWLKLKEKEGDISLASKDAIAHLITCFADPRADLGESDFRQSIIDRVMIPLIGEWRHWRGTVE